MKRALQLSLTFIVLVAGAARSEDKQSIGKVVVQQGQLSAKDEAGETRALTNGSEIFKEEQIIADDKSKAQIRLTDDTLIAIAENSTFRVSGYTFNKTPEDAVSLEIVLGTVRMLPGEAERSGENGIKVLTAEVEVTAEGTMFTTTSTDKGTAVGFYHGSGTAANAGGTLRLGKRGRYDFTFVPKDSTKAPMGQLSQPVALTALETTGTSEDAAVTQAVSDDIKNRLRLKKLSLTDAHKLRQQMRIGGAFADREMIKPYDRQVDLHNDGIGCCVIHQ